MIKKILKSWLFKEELQDLILIKKELSIQKDLNRNFIKKLEDNNIAIKQTVKQIVLEEFGECAVDLPHNIPKRSLF